MGCDLHLHVEKRTKKGKWRGVRIKSDDSVQRNYDLFGVLANVRNYNKLPPIALPKGLPADVSPRVAKLAKKMGGDGHSHSYLSLLELEAYPWESKFVRTGHVLRSRFKKWQEDGGELWEYTDDPRAISDAYNVRVSVPAMEALIRGGLTELNGKTPYVELESEMPKTQFVEEFYTEFLPYLRSLGGALEDVRIVFWFDEAVRPYQ